MVNHFFYLIDSKKNHNNDLNQIPFFKCLGCFIFHNGEVDGSIINDYLRHQEGTGWCNHRIESSLYIENHIFDLSVTFLTDYCSNKKTD